MSLKVINCLVILIALINPFIANSQVLQGKITSNGIIVSFANIVIDSDLKRGISSDEFGSYRLNNLSLGSHQLIVSSIGMVKKTLDINITEGLNNVNIDLKPSIYNLDQVVVTGTKTFKRRTQSPVIVNVINSKQLENVQACNLAEGLKFQPGLRVETDC